jgi:hypothetical protein
MYIIKDNFRKYVVVNKSITYLLSPPKVFKYDAALLARYGGCWYRKGQEGAKSRKLENRINEGQEHESKHIECV